MTVLLDCINAQIVILRSACKAVPEAAPAEAGGRTPLIG
jgi:hypothetical protein